MISLPIRCTARSPLFTSLGLQRSNQNVRKLHTTKLVRPDDRMCSSQDMAKTMALFSAILFTTTYAIEYNQDESMELSSTRCEAKVMVPGSLDSGLRAIRALEAKGEAQRAKLTRFLREFHDLGKEVREEKIRRFVTRMCPEAARAVRDEQISLRRLELSNLSPDGARAIINEMREGHQFDKESLIRLMKVSTKTLKEDETLIDLRGKADKLTVVGDMHGSFDCLWRVLELAGDLSEEGRALVVAGDFVDRGENSLEVLCTLLLLKIAHPDKIVLLRGNHEDTMIASAYGFQQEVRKKYGYNRSEAIWGELGNVFAALPIAARTENAVIMHGGLPSDNFSLSDLEAVTTETRSGLPTLVDPVNDQEQLLQDILWSDPTPLDGAEPNERGCGIEFGPDVARSFLDRHNLKFILRGHGHAEEGVDALDCGDGRYVVTIFSTADYPNGEGNNVGAILNIDDEGHCEPVTFSPSLDTRTEVDLVTRYDVDVESFIVEKRDALERAFHCISRDGYVTPSQWAAVMQDQLSLQDVPWKSLQPSLAPTAASSPGKIDWRGFLSRFGRDAPNMDSFVKDQMIIFKERRDELVQVLKLLDTEGSGEIDYNTFVAGVNVLNRTHGRKDTTLETSESIFRAFDPDDNGVVDIRSFSETLGRSAPLLGELETYKATNDGGRDHESDTFLTLFKVPETDFSGVVGRDEFYTIIEALNERLPEENQFEDPDELFEELDLDGSGEVDLRKCGQIFQSV